MVESDLHTEELLRGFDHTIQLDRAMRHAAGRLKADTLILFTADHSYDFSITDGSKIHLYCRPTWLLNSATIKTASVSILYAATTATPARKSSSLRKVRAPGASMVSFPTRTLFRIMMDAFGWK
jgi:alkaline phosphatase